MSTDHGAGNISSLTSTLPVIYDLINTVKDGQGRHKSFHRAVSDNQRESDIGICAIEIKDAAQYPKSVHHSRFQCCNKTNNERLNKNITLKSQVRRHVSLFTEHFPLYVQQHMASVKVSSKKISYNPKIC